jgi:comEA protein
MFFYRTVLTAVAAVVIASPVFADDAAAPAKSDVAAAPVVASADNSTQSTAETSQPSSTDQAASSAEVKAVSININTATAKQLEKVKGINAAKAKAIIKYRKKHGDFKSLNDLNKVKGFSKIKAADLQAIKDQLKVD